MATLGSAVKDYVTKQGVEGLKHDATIGESIRAWGKTEGVDVNGNLSDILNNITSKPEPEPEPTLTSVEITPDPVEGAVAGTAVAFTATPDVTEGTTYVWEGTNVTFDHNNVASVNATPTASGACTVKVTATNGDETATDTVSFTASEAETSGEDEEGGESA